MTDLGALYPTDLVTLREVGLRDGLQLVKSFPSTAAKVEWLKREYAAGVHHFEVGSFLPASRMPEEVLCGALARAGLPRLLEIQG